MVRSVALIVIFTLVGFVCQIAIFPAFGAVTIGPNMIIAAMVPAALLLGPWAGMAVGFVGGLAVDLFAGLGVGVSALILTLCGLTVGLIRDQVNAKNMVFAMVMAAICYGLMDLVSAMFLYFSRMSIHISLLSIWRMLLSALFTAFFTMINHLILRRSTDSGTRRSPYLQ